MIDVCKTSTESSPTTTTNVEQTLTKSRRDDDLLPADHRPQSAADSDSNDGTLDDDGASGSTVTLDGVPESIGETGSSSAAGSGRNQQLFVPELIGGGGHGSRLTVEDIYIEAMTLDAEIRVFRRSLDAAGRRELSRIIDFCRDALHRKLLLRSVEQAQGGLGSGLSGRRSVSSENLSIPTDFVDSKRLELIAETAV